MHVQRVPASDLRCILTLCCSFFSDFRLPLFSGLSPHSNLLPHADVLLQLHDVLVTLPLLEVEELLELSKELLGLKLFFLNPASLFGFRLELSFNAFEPADYFIRLDLHEELISFHPIQHVLVHLLLLDLIFVLHLHRIQHQRQLVNPMLHSQRVRLCVRLQVVAVLDLKLHPLDLSLLESVLFSCFIVPFANQTERCRNFSNFFVRS
mmetsp:Transcript_4913/g.9201  ORF Transcript_4913/g.9201 Transcript_4913/m.9201 type:complete len:208 (-) Transcript_4913:106-729(-)